MSSSVEYAVIVAGGSGTRMQSEIPKQFLQVGGKPLLMHTLEAFYRYSDEVKIILVLPAASSHRVRTRFSSMCSRLAEPVGTNR